MARKRPTLAEVQRLYPQDMARCAGYTWHLGTRIGKGSFGEVYLGWTLNGREEVAVKAVSKSYFKQDPKVKENLEREIRIMKLLRNCEYVVHLDHVQDMKQHIVLVMELCEYDLDYLVKNSPFREDDITLFLFQLSKGMKALREQNIVHRDLKPGNILIKKDPATGKMKIKLADFGFARHFTEEGTKKPVDMHSLAGTPVFMAPEALRCVFYPGEHYDDKVDIWSIGALLYKVIVGQCGFYAQLQDIPKILKHKKDAIAFERVNRNINYIQELPPSVFSRLSPDYRTKMNSLLKSLLKLDPQERMSFPEFFEFVEDLVHSKIEVLNILHGTSGKIMYDRGMMLEQLKQEIEAQLGVKVPHQLVFSPASPHFISPNSAPSPAHFNELMELCGASRGNGTLYLLPIAALEKDTVCDLSCLAQLRFAVSNQQKCVELITDHKFSNEIVRAINQLHNQLKRQERGVAEFRGFNSRQFEVFRAGGGYQEATRQGSQTAARLSLAIEWLGSLPECSIPQNTEVMKQYKLDVGKLVMELDTLYMASENQSTAGSGEGHTASEAPAELIRTAKTLPELRRVEMFGRCQSILTKSEEMAHKTWQVTRQTLCSLFASVCHIWDMTGKVKQLSELCQKAEDLLNSQHTVIASLTTRSVPSNGLPVSGPAPPVVVTPPGWPRPPPPTSPFQPSPSFPYQPSPNSHAAQPQVTGDMQSLKDLREERDHYEQLFNEKVTECVELSQLNSHLKEQLGQRKRASSSSCDEEKTLAPGNTLRPATPTEDRSLRPSLRPEEVQVLEGLREQLKSFCMIADHLKPGVLPVDRHRAQTSPSTTRAASSPMLYPALHGNSPDLKEYSIITMAGSPERQSSEGAMAAVDSVEVLIPQASQLMAALKDGLKDLSQGLATENSVSENRTMVKIAKPGEYIQGDIALFNPLRLPKSKTTVPIILHAEKPCPYIFMDSSSYSLFGIRPGRTPELVVGKLTERPRPFRYEEDREMMKEFNVKGEFYRVRVEPVAFKFLPSKAPPRPPPPKGSSKTLGV